MSNDKTGNNQDLSQSKSILEAVIDELAPEDRDLVNQSTKQLKAIMDQYDPLIVALALARVTYINAQTLNIEDNNK